ncbi:MAG: pyruvate dehydrogenase complex dihydrolipoamide acetyltransferase [Candidatus Puniceispirillaceae bacterium]
MSIEIKMPALSPTMTDGTLARWLVSEGDEVRSGDVIAEIETDKATMEVEAIDDGIVAIIAVPAGTENVAVNDVIAVLAEDGEDPASLSLTDAPSAPSAPSTPAPAPEQAAPAASSVSSAPAVQASQAPQIAPSQAKGARLFASPLARRIAAQNDLPLDGITGSGPNGRIIKADIELALSQPQSMTAQAGANQAQAAPSSSYYAAESRFVPHSAMRRTIATRLTESKQNAPHFYLTVDCEIDALLAARKTMNEMAPDGVKISVNDMVVRAAAQALMQVPDVNGSYEADGCRYFANADICIAVAIEGGLVTPVIKQVQHKGMAEIAAQSKQLAGQARDGSLPPEAYAGGSFTISNLGMFGIREFAAVINPPQGAILAVGAGEQRPVVKNGELAIATVMSVTLSADHRVVDGALGAQWMQVFKGLIENPVAMLL